MFAAGMGKRFNFRDMNTSILIHPELGIGADAILPEKRIIAPSRNPPDTAEASGYILQN